MSGKKDVNEYGQGLSDAIIKDIKDAISDLDYGTVMVKVHNGKIVQIEITRKKRFDTGLVENGSGI